MSFYDVLNLVTSALSVVAFVLSMLIIVLISACFLGRNVKLSRKLVLSACGIVLLQTVLTVIDISLGDYIIDYLTSLLSGFIPGKDAEEIVPALVMTVISFIVNLISFAYAFVFYLIAFKKKKFLRAVEATVGLYIYYLYMQNIVEYSIFFLMGGDLELLTAFTDPNVQYSPFVIAVVLVDLIISSLLCALLYFAYYKKGRFYTIRVRNRVFFIIWMVIFTFIPTIVFYGGDDTELRFTLLSLMYGMVYPIVGCLAPFLLVMTAVEKSLKDKTEFQDNYLKAQLEYMEQYKRRQEETRSFRHDIINNLSLAAMMMDEGRIEEADSHIKDLLGNVKALSPEYVTGDEMLDLIVAMKADRMKELGIRFTCDGVIDGGLNMKPTDMCSVFANALDNAIEASVKCEDPVVAVDIKRTSKFFVIKISNSVIARVDIDKLYDTPGYTSKKDQEYHGFGFRNIENTVERYNGILKVSSEDDTFELSIMMPR